MIAIGGDGDTARLTQLGIDRVLDILGARVKRYDLGGQRLAAVIKAQREEASLTAALECDPLNLVAAG